MILLFPYPTRPPTIWREEPPFKALKIGGEGVIGNGGWGTRKKDKMFCFFWLCRIWVISQKYSVSMALCEWTPRPPNSCCTSLTDIFLPVLSSVTLGPQSPCSMKWRKSHWSLSKWYREGDMGLLLSHPGASKREWVLLLILFPLHPDIYVFCVSYFFFL